MLTNILSGTSDQTQAVIECNAVPALVHVLSPASSEDVRQQAAWALGNIAGDGPVCRDLVLAAGALAPLLGLLDDNNKLSMLRNATWALSNFNRGKPRPCFDYVRPALPALARLLHSSTDQEVLTDACWGLSYLSDENNDKVAAVIDAGVCKRLVELLAHPSTGVSTPALRTVGQLVAGDDVQTQSVINCGALPCLLALLTGDHTKSIKKEACWAVSNIATTGNEDQIQAVIDAEIVPPLVSLLGKAEFDIKKEAAWALLNVTKRGTHPQIRYLVAQGCIKPMCDLLACSNARIITVVLEGLGNILEVGACDAQELGAGAVNAYTALVDEAEGLEKMVQLQTHANNDIREKARTSRFLFPRSADSLFTIAARSLPGEEDREIVFW